MRLFEQTALQLHKAFPDNGPYYCWRVMSIVMQVCVCVCVCVL